MRRLLTELGIAFVMLAFAPASVIGADPLDPETVVAIQRYVEAEIATLGVPGAAIAIVHDDEIVFAEGFGRADAHGRAVTPQTPFDLASVSKSLTAIAVMQQVASGGLELDAPVRRYLPWFGDEQPALAEVTIRDLLGHQSGWTTGDGQANLVDEYAGTDAIERNVRRLAATAPTNPHGVHEYSNANYDLLAYLVEVTSATPFGEFVDANVFGPLDMRHSHASRAAAEADGMARGFYPAFGVPIQYEAPYVPGGLGSGFLFSSAEDLAHSLIFHLNEGGYADAQVLAPELVEELHRPISRPDPYSGYAGGLYIYPLWAAGRLPDEVAMNVEVPVVLEHGGDHASAATAILVLPAERVGVVVLLNMNDSAAPSRFHQVHYGIANLLLGLDPPETVAYEDVISQYGRPIIGAIVVLQLIGVALALRRIRRWRRSEAARPRSGVGIAAHLVPALVVDLAVAGLLWWLLIDRSDAPFAVVVAYAPDIAILIALVIALGLGWGLLRTAWSVRALRSGPVGA